jgi:hypothetical protein
MGPVGIGGSLGFVCSALFVFQISKLSLPVYTLDDDDINHTAPIRNSKHDHAMILFLPVNMRMSRRPLKR